MYMKNLNMPNNIMIIDVGLTSKSLVEICKEHTHQDFTDRVQLSQITNLNPFEVVI